MAQFSPMKQQLLGIVLLGLLATSIFTVVSSPKQALAANEFINIDLSVYGPDNVNNDYPFGITCDDANNVYVTLFNQGRLVKIDKATREVLASYNDPEGPSSAGQGFYAIARDPSTGNLFVNERDTGKVWKFDPTGIAWTSIPIVEEITGNADVTYPQTFVSKPNLIRIDENPSGHGIHTYQVGMTSFGGVLYTASSVWVGLGYNVDFDIEAETNAGVTDLFFSGLARIDPLTDAVTRYPIAGSISPTGLDVDSAASNIIWVTDQAANKVFKFDTNTNTVVETISLAVGSNPRGLDNDSTHVFVALNKQGNGDNSEILKITKANTVEQVIIDTGAENTNEGAFTVYLQGNLLLWTDLSRHVGAINLQNNQKTSVTTAFADQNHFGCLVGTDFWFAGKGSAVVGTINLQELESTLASAPPSLRNLANDNAAKITADFVTGREAIVIPDVSLEGQPLPNDPTMRFAASISLYDIARGDPYGLMSVVLGAYLAGIDFASLTENQQIYLYMQTMYG